MCECVPVICRGSPSLWELVRRGLERVAFTTQIQPVRNITGVCPPPPSVQTTPVYNLKTHCSRGVMVERWMSRLKHSFSWPCCHVVKTAGPSLKRNGQLSPIGCIRLLTTQLIYKHSSAQRDDPVLVWNVVLPPRTLQWAEKYWVDENGVWEFPLTSSTLCNANFKWGQ